MLKKGLILFVCVLLVAACKKNDSPVGIGLLPANDIINAKYIEFTPDIAYSTYNWNNYRVASTKLSNSQLLGSMNDPVFGRTDASIYCSFETDYSNTGLGQLTFTSTPSLDSAVLVLSYNYQPGTSTIFVGDTTNPLSLDVYPLLYNISPDSTYFSTGNNYYYTATGTYNKAPIPYDASQRLTYNGQSVSFTPHLNYYPPIKKDTTAYLLPNVRIKLSSQFAESLFPSCVNDNSKFQQLFKGLYITTKHSILPQPSYGSIFFVYMNTYSYIMFYYHLENNPTAPLQLPFYCGGYSTRFSHFKHDYGLASSDLQSQLSPMYDTTRYNATNNLYVQGCAGVGAVLKFPGLLSWMQSLPYNIAINKAELLLKTDMSNNDFYNLTNYPLPGRLYLQGDTMGGPKALIEDPYNFGGFYDLSNNQYVFEIPNTVSQLARGTTLSTKFYLTQYNNATFQERLVIGGNTATTPRPVKLRIWYTQLTSKK
ncbi:MAG: DUF4270 family protein [Bacteroidetes bacterium]|nr:DUF4270 family protein [Bacteroidota bacterium]